MRLHCRQCHSPDLTEVMDFGPQPIAHRLPRSADEAEELFPFCLHLCKNCGLVQVVEPIDPQILYTDFNYNFSSWKYEPHLEAELDSILEAGPFRSVVEIGCNDGRFLENLEKRGIETVVGIEPNPVSSQIAMKRGFQVYNSMVTNEVCAQAVETFGRFDLLVTRQVVEHVPDLDQFFDCIRSLITDDGMLFLDAPDCDPVFALGDASLLWEEHVSYFTGPVLQDLLTRQGFRCLRMDRYDFSGASLAILAKRDDSLGADNGGTSDGGSILGYAARVNAYRERLRSALGEARRQGWEIVLYGVGVRGCVATNRLGIGDLIDFAVDDQAERQGWYLPGAKLEIRASDVLSGREAPVLCLLAVNNENEVKVRQRVESLRDGNGTTAFLSLCGPKDITQELQELGHVLGSTPEVGLADVEPANQS